MALYCPNCSCTLQMGEVECPKCGALFGPHSIWLPTTKPRGPVPPRPLGIPDHRTEARREPSEGREKVQAPKEWKRKWKRHRVYGLVIACVAIALVVSIFREGIATLLALSWIYAMTLLNPMAQPAQPLPLIAQNLIPLRDSLIFPYALVAMVFVQGALLLRRVVICVAARRIVVPPALSRALTILLLIGLTSWCVPILGELLLRLLVLGAGWLIPGLALAAGVVSAFILPLVWIPAMNLLGPIFFALELHSLLEEGLLPQVASSTDDPATLTADLMQRRSALK